MPGLHGIIDVALDVAFIGPVLRWKHTAGSAPCITQHRMNDSVAVDSERDGASQTRVLQPRVAKIEDYVLEKRARGTPDAQARLSLQIRNQIGLQRVIFCEFADPFG